MGNTSQILINDSKSDSIAENPPVIPKTNSVPSEHVIKLKSTTLTNVAFFLNIFKTGLIIKLPANESIQLNNNIIR
ncbi:LOW QUALITY PROTEIN: hypothetical protein HZS_5954 [Henneguya salminicola]|nr:LOW QUALITY PROTEIN: hypothetical protein HZS_5954 [Henneguya salminicola]